MHQRGTEAVFVVEVGRRRLGYQEIASVWSERSEGRPLRSTPKKMRRSLFMAAATTPCRSCPGLSGGPLTRRLVRASEGLSRREPGLPGLPSLSRRLGLPQPL